MGDGGEGSLPHVHIFQCNSCYVNYKMKRNTDNFANNARDQRNNIKQFGMYITAQSAFKG